MSVDADTDALAARDLLVSAAREAGAVALEYLNPGSRTSAHVVTKAGGSPVTDADLAADSLLKRRLREALPDAGGPPRRGRRFERLSCRSLIIVDPIDGTRAFVSAIRAGPSRWRSSSRRPVAGVVHGRRSTRSMRPPVATAHVQWRDSRDRPGWPPRVAAGPKLMIEAMAAELGAPIEIVPRVPRSPTDVPGGARHDRFRGRGRKLA